MTRQFGHHRTFIIAEAGVNHNGDLTLARRLVDAGADAGADAVKFQTFRAEALVGADVPRAAYQKRNAPHEASHLSMLRRLELDHAAHGALMKHARARGIQFLSTPFDTESLAFLNQKMELPLIKLSSGSITHGPLLLAAGQTGKPVILSTGMALLGEVAAALGVLAFGYLHPGRTPEKGVDFAALAQTPAARAILEQRVTLMHCTTEYPTPPTETNLRAMRTLSDRFGLAVGFSDHTEGLSGAIAATALGAVVLEKHFTLDRTLPGPDHKASLEPSELARMVAAIRETETMMGDGEKKPTASEMPNIAVARVSLVASRPIIAGEAFSPDNLAVKRPGSGVSGLRFWDMLGRPAPRAFTPGELIES